MEEMAMCGNRWIKPWIRSTTNRNPNFGSYAENHFMLMCSV